MWGKDEDRGQHGGPRKMEAGRAVILEQDVVSGARSQKRGLALGTTEVGEKTEARLILNQYGSWSQKDGGRDKAGNLILKQYGACGVALIKTEAADKTEAGKQYGVSGGDEAGALILNQDGVSGAWSQAEEGEGGDEAGRDEAGAPILNQYGVSGGDETGALTLNQYGAGTRPERLPFNQYGVSGAWSQTEEGEGGDEAGAPILNQDGVVGAWSEAEKTAEAGTRPERLSSTKRGFQARGLKLRRRRRRDEAGAPILNQYGVAGAWSQAEEGEGGDEAGALILNQEGVSGAWSEAEKTAEAGEGGDQAGALILNQDGVAGAWSQAEEGEGGDQAGALILNQDGVAGAWSQAEEGEGGDQAGALILNQDGVAGAWSQAEEGEGGDQAGALILNQDGVAGAWSQAEEGEGGDQAGALILNQDGVAGAWSQAEEGEGGDQAGGDEARALILNQYGVPGGDEAGALILNQYGVPGGDEAGALILNQYGAGALILNQYGVPGGDEAGALILNQYGVPGALSSTDMGSLVRGVNPKQTKEQGRVPAALIFNLSQSYEAQPTQVQHRPSRPLSNGSGGQKTKPAHCGRIVYDVPPNLRANLHHLFKRPSEQACMRGSSTARSSPATAMAGHFEPDLIRQMIARFMDEIRKVPVRFGIQQPLESAELSADITHAIGELSRHMHLDETDSQWLMYLASHLEPELGATLIPALWRLKEDVMMWTVRCQRPREPSPFSLPPAAAESGTDGEEDYLRAANAIVGGDRRAVPDCNGCFNDLIPTELQCRKAGADANRQSHDRIARHGERLTLCLFIAVSDDQPQGWDVKRVGSFTRITPRFNIMGEYGTYIGTHPKKGHDIILQFHDYYCETIREIPLPTVVDQDEVAEAIVPDTCPRDTPSGLADDGREVQVCEEGERTGDVPGNGAMCSRREGPVPEEGDRIMVMKEAWLQLVMNRLKTLEIRGAPAALGRTWLGCNGQIHGAANIVNCSIITEADFQATRAQHRHLGEMPNYKKTYALALQDVTQLEPSIDYYRLPATSPWAVFRTGPTGKSRRSGAQKRTLEQAHDTKPCEDVPTELRAEASPMPLTSGMVDPEEPSLGAGDRTDEHDDRNKE
ncbi:unnamed protein product [Symbiodinium sp. CCMP2592]|nr:unnamed protein product [Symbiodinium sp. CCMP2592]